MDQAISGEKPLKVDYVGWVWLIYGLCIGVCTGVFFLVTILTHSRHTPGDIAFELAVAAVAIFCLLGTGWLAVKQRVTFWSDRVDYTNGLGATRSLLRSGIKGLRRSTKGGTLILIPRDEFAKPIKVSAALLGKTQTKSWFDGIPDLDAQDFEAARKALENDTRLGATNTERLEKLARMSLVTRILNGVGFVFGFWSLLTPWPYEVPVFGAIATMLIALAVKSYFGSFMEATGGGGRTDPRPSLGATIFVCAVGVGVRGLGDNHVLDWMMALEWGGAISFGISFVLIMQDERMRANVSSSLFFILMLAVFFSAALVTANRVFDRGPTATFHTLIDDKRVNTGKSTTYEVTLDTWGDQPAGMIVRVPYTFYKSVQLSDVVCVILSKGALGLRHFQIRRCSVGIDRRSEIVPASRPS